MNPQQPYTPPPQGNPYEFIINPQQPPKNSKFGPLGNSLVKKALIILGSLFAVMIVIAVVLSATGGNKLNKEDLVGLVQTQNEIMRVSEQGSFGAARQSSRNLAITTEYTVKTQQQQVMALLAKNGRTVGKKELTLKLNAKTDQQLKAAKSTSTFDLVYSQIVEKELKDYSLTLQSMQAKATNKTERELLSSYNEQTQLLLTQIPYTQKDILSE